MECTSNASFSKRLGPPIHLFQGLGRNRIPVILCRVFAAIRQPSSPFCRIYFHEHRPVHKIDSLESTLFDFTLYACAHPLIESEKVIREKFSVFTTSRANAIALPKKGTPCISKQR